MGNRKSAQEHTSRDKMPRLHMYSCRLQIHKPDSGSKLVKYQYCCLSAFLHKTHPQTPDQSHITSHFHRFNPEPLRRTPSCKQEDRSGRVVPAVGPPRESSVKYGELARSSFVRRGSELDSVAQDTRTGL